MPHCHNNIRITNAVNVFFNNIEHYFGGNNFYNLLHKQGTNLLHKNMSAIEI